MMHRATILATIAVTASFAQPETVSVSMRGGAETSSPGMVQARAMAARLLAGAGITLEWCTRPAKCHDWARRIVITLEPVAPANFPAQAIAEAQMFEGHIIRVYLDRVCGHREAPLAAFLAHVLAHEITHVLQRIDRHSPSGLMKARWSRGDFAAMTKGGLPLVAEDIELVRLAAARRQR